MNFSCIIDKGGAVLENWKKIHLKNTYWTAQAWEETKQTVIQSQRHWSEMKNNRLKINQQKEHCMKIVKIFFFDYTYTRLWKCDRWWHRSCELCWQQAFRGMMTKEQRKLIEWLMVGDWRLLRPRLCWTVQAQVWPWHT